MPSMIRLGDLLDWTRSISIAMDLSKVKFVFVKLRCIASSLFSGKTGYAVVVKSKIDFLR